MKILAIDDSPTLRQFITRSLHKHSEQFTVTTAKDGEEGLAMAESEPPELILLDFVLPGLRGDEVCRRLAGGSRTGQIPVVLMSSSTKDMLSTEAECRNVVKTLSKPFTPELLCATVNAISREVAAAAPTAADVGRPLNGSHAHSPLAAPQSVGRETEPEPASTQAEKSPARRILFAGQTGSFSLLSALAAIEQGNLTGMLRLCVEGRQIQLYTQRGGLLCVTTHEARAYLGKEAFRFSSSVIEEQEKTSCPAYLHLARRGALPLDEALEKTHLAGVRLIAPAWTRAETWFEFEPLDELPEWLTGLRPYPGPMAEWAIETLREVGDECLSAHAWGEPTGIPAYTRAGYERIQQIALNEQEIAFASRIDSRRTLADIAREMQASVDAATHILYRFLCLEILDYWPASILRQGK